MLLEEKLLLDFKYKEILANLYVDTVLKNLRTSLHQGEKAYAKVCDSVLVPSFFRVSFPYLATIRKHRHFSAMFSLLMCWFTFSLFCTADKAVSSVSFMSGAVAFLYVLKS